jgi:hypothetical protein
MPDSSSPSGGDLPPASPATTTETAAPETGAAPSPAALPVPRPQMVRWLIVGIAAIVAGSLWSWRGKSASQKIIDAPITLVTSDNDDLACALDKVVGHYKCEFRAPGQPWPEAPAPKDKLAPYFTTDRQMFLIPGLFEQPALAARYRSESPAGKPRDQLHRFVARCKLHLVEKVESVQTRWMKGAPFGGADGAWIAEPEDCKVE